MRTLGPHATPRDLIDTTSEVGPRRVGGHHVVLALLLAATIPWRKNVYFDGAIDPVVISKAAMSVLALLVALHCAGRGRVSSVPAAPIILLAAYLVVSVVGGLAHGDLMAAAIVASRVAILTITICLLVVRYGPPVVAEALIHLFGVLVVAAALSGLPSAASGRLGGGVPPLNPNELGFMASVCFVWLFAKILRAQETTLHVVLAGGAVLVVLLTGSRASLAALCVAIVVMLFRATAMSRRGISAVALLAPLLGYVALGTDVLSSVFLRGGERGITTLSNRTIAWNAALTSDRDPWETWFGEGLATKKIAVPGQYWNTQLLDSSYVSALVQAGFVGLAIVTLLMVTSLVRAMTAPKPMRAVWVGLIVLLGTRAVLESGLFDSSTAFMVLLVAVLGCRTPDPSVAPTEAHVEPIPLARNRHAAESADPLPIPTSAVRTSVSLRSPIPPLGPNPVRPSRERRGRSSRPGWPSYGRTTDPARMPPS